MKTFSTASLAWIDTVEELLKSGERLESRDGDCIELTGFGFKLDNVQYPLATVRNPSTTYAAAETLWYLSGTNDIRMLEHYAPQYRRFANPHSDIAHGAYGYRLRNSPEFMLGQANTGLAFMNQLDAVTRLLSKSPNTRQALVSMWSPSDLCYSIVGETPDIPCTVCLQFLLRNDELHVVAFMRSNDVWLGLPYDVFAFTTFQRIVADRLKVKTGTYTHTVGSIHLYQRNRAKAIDCIKSDYAEHSFNVHVEGSIEAAVMAERLARTTGKVYASKLEPHTIAHELALRCALRHCKDAVPKTELMQKGL